MEVKEKINAENLKINQGTIRFDDIYFEYPNTDKEILKSVNLTFSGGKMEPAP